MLGVTVLALLFEGSVCEVLQSGSLVYPKLLEEKGLNGERFLRINQDLILKLEKSTILSKNFALLDVQGDKIETRMAHGTELEKNLYHNKEHMSSLVVIPRDNGVEVEGILKHNIRIKPLPAAERSTEGLIAHEVHEIEHPKVQHEAVDVLPFKARRLNFYNRRIRRRHTQVPDSYEFEIMVVVDKKYQSHFLRKSLLNLTAHVITIMNSVNLRFSEMESPKIRLILVGFAILASDTFHVKQRNGIKGQETLRRFVIERERYIDRTNFDAVLILTGWNLIGFLGLAYVGSLCDPNGAAIAEDNPLTYNGVLTIAHELAHVLGAEHDGEDPTPYIHDHPGATRCFAGDNYLMGELNLTSENQYRLSRCTEDQIRHVLTQKPSWCTGRATQMNFLGEWTKIAGIKVLVQPSCDHLYPRESPTESKNYQGGDKLRPALAMDSREEALARYIQCLTGSPVRG